MWDGVGIVREGPKLRAALEEFGRLKQVARDEVSVFSPAKCYNYDWVEALEVIQMVDVAEMMAAAALARTESRGAHYRTDHPAIDNESWLRETVVHDEGGRLRVATQPVHLTELSPMDVEVSH